MDERGQRRRIRHRLAVLRHAEETWIPAPPGTEPEAPKPVGHCQRDSWRKTDIARSRIRPKVRC